MVFINFYPKKVPKIFFISEKYSELRAVKLEFPHKYIKSEIKSEIN